VAVGNSAKNVGCFKQLSAMFFFYSLPMKQLASKHKGMYARLERASSMKTQMKTLIHMGRKKRNTSTHRALQR
jgi:hypothetical protein